ncbi:DUF4394 domain-containing protein [Hymenobacter radiodurans]|uniref:DUF4394 domain-containing protein n=1 Tax=Hymenobacter radiodurans TaxID=2496028 RepID=UPI0010590F36|nr:DUF4394 domain-containing protein [Hymenobacter radiodurans]
MLKPSSLATWGAAVLLLSSLTSCEDILEQYFPKPTPTPPTIPTFPPLGQDIAFYALAGGTRLDGYSTANAATRTSSVALTGLGSGETLLAIDFRPATGQLYGVSSASRLYVINQNTGAARAIGAEAFSPAVAGNLVGFDFNPTVDRIRLVTSAGQNLRINPETGTVAATDGAINGAVGATLTGVAYTSNTSGAATTALYAINTQNQQLYLVNPPNEGSLVPVGNLNLPVSGNGGFDIDAKTGTALGLYPVNGRPTLFAVNLATGAAQPLAQYAATLDYAGIAIPTQPVAYSAYSTQARVNEYFSYFFIFDPTNPRASYVQKTITGLPNASDFIYGLDFRPATGQLYALVGSQIRDFSGFYRTDNARLYSINPATAVATLVTPLSASLENNSTFGFDFNPVADRLRIVSSNGQNLRVNPVDGVVEEDRRLNPGFPSITAAAYSNNVAGATTTNLYVIGRDKLFLQTPPNEGRLVEVGDLGLDSEVRDGFDIGSTSNKGYAILSTPGFTRLYTIDLERGRATQVSSSTISDFAGAMSGFTIGLGF